MSYHVLSQSSKYCFCYEFQTELQKFDQSYIRYNLLQRKAFIEFRITKENIHWEPIIHIGKMKSRMLQNVLLVVSCKVTVLWRESPIQWDIIFDLKQDWHTKTGAVQLQQSKKKMEEIKFSKYASWWLLLEL